ncbi:HK97-gp10 family putative phage morphogenesis protein [Xylanivirga thermophila]|uniref:HK97-gp10 family putative phage morphogenesis protein n=1 Tax=Xylanivirga thermophila TaxID=2496273 RepID=UPI0039F62FD0
MKLEGMENLLNELDKLGQKGSRIENKALKEAGNIVKESIVKEVPVRTGKLKENITVSNVKSKDGVKKVEVGPGKDEYYAAFLEFGTTNMNANPFISRGYENSKEEAEKVIVEEIKKGLGL